MTSPIRYLASSDHSKLTVLVDGKETVTIQMGDIVRLEAYLIFHHMTEPNEGHTVH